MPFLAEKLQLSSLRSQVAPAERAATLPAPELPCPFTSSQTCDLQSWIEQRITQLTVVLRGITPAPLLEAGKCIFAGCGRPLTPIEGN